MLDKLYLTLPYIGGKITELGVYAEKNFLNNFVCIL